jgi:hypothetical protein
MPTFLTVALARVMVEERQKGGDALAWYARRLNESFATRSPRKRTSSDATAMSVLCPGADY